MATPSRPPPPPARPLDLDITIVSAKHLKNVNWRTGPLKPYAIFWLDPDRRFATKSDDSGSTRPVWNEQFLVPISISPNDSVLTLEIFHSKPLESSKPLVGDLRVRLSDLIDSDDSSKLRSFELRRPSGRPQGKIRLKLSICERPLPDYGFAPQPSYYYSSAPPPPSPRNYREYPPSPAAPISAPPPPHSYGYGPYSDPHSGYYAGYYSQQPPPTPPRPFYDRYSGGPSAPVDYAPPVPYDQKQRNGKMGLGSGLAVGAVAGSLGGLALDEGVKYEDKIAERAGSEATARDDYRDYRSEY